MTLEAVILARVSTKEQEEGHSLDAQIRNLETYAAGKGFVIIKTFKVVESSNKRERPEFDQMIAFIKSQKKRIALIVDTVDRLQRSFKEKPILDELIKRDAVELHFVKENNVLTKDANSSQNMMWNMGVVMAQAYTDCLRDNVKRSIKQKLHKGEWIAMAPLGYKNAKDADGRSTVVLDGERAFLVKRIFNDYSTGAYSLSEICRAAKKWGLRTQSGKPVSVQTLHRLIQNPFYYGIMQIKGQLYPHHYSTLIDKALFERCQEVRLGNGQHQAVKETKTEFVLRGMVKCKVSGRRVTPDIKKGKHVYLITRDPVNPEKKMFIKEEIVLAQLETVFNSLYIPPDILEVVMDSLRKNHELEVDYHGVAIDSLVHESKDLDARLNRLTDFLIDGSITQDIYAKKRDEMTSRQFEINDQLQQHHLGNRDFKIALSTLLLLVSKTPELFSRSNVDEKRQIIGFLFSNLELEGEKLHFSLKKPLELFVNMAGLKDWRPPYGIHNEFIRV